MEIWRKLAKENGLPGVYFIAQIANTSTIKRNTDGTLVRVIPNLKNSKDVYNNILALGFDGINSYGKSRGEMCYQGKSMRIAKQVLHKKLPFLHRSN